MLQPSGITGAFPQGNVSQKKYRGNRMTDRIRLDGRVAVVTGAAGVIGSATIRLLAERGARIVAVDRRQADLEGAIKDLPASAEAIAITSDVTGEDGVKDYVRAALDRFGSIAAF